MFSKTLVILIGIYLLLTIIGIGSGCMEYSMLHNLKNVTEAEADANDIRQAIIGLLQTLVYIPCFILFLIWLNRYSKNTHSMARKKLTYTPGWTVGYFFIPILSLFRPYQAVSELYRENNQNASQSILAWWWAAWIISTLAGKASFKLSIRAKTLSELKLANQVTIFSDAIDVITFSLLLIMIVKMTKWQIEKHDQVQKLETTP